MDISEDKFIQQINAKEVGAFRILFEHFYNYLVLYAMKRVRQREVAEDVVQKKFSWRSGKVRRNIILFMDSGHFCMMRFRIGVWII